MSLGKIPDRIATRSVVNEIANFLRGFTVLLGLVPITYSILTFVFGDALWAAGQSPIYEMAINLPMAPESWGVFAGTCGVLILVGEFAEKHTVTTAACVLQAVWCMTFGIFFAIDCIQNNTSVGAPGALTYISLGVMYLGRARLAWIWR